MNFEIDRLATAFERDWSPESRSFKRYLEQISESSREILLLELVLLDVELALSAGVEVDPLDYEFYGKTVVFAALQALSERHVNPVESEPKKTNKSYPTSRDCV